MSARYNDLRYVFINADVTALMNRRLRGLVTDKANHAHGGSET